MRWPATGWLVSAIALCALSALAYPHNTRSVPCARGDRRCSPDAVGAAISILPGGPTPDQVATGSLTAATGQTVLDTRASHRFCRNTDGGLVELLNNKPCVEPEGLSIEQTARNSLLYSTDIGNAVWIADGVTVTGSSCTAPDGTVTGATVDIPDTSSAGTIAVVYQSLTFSNTNDHEASVYVSLLDGGLYSDGGFAQTCLIETVDGGLAYSGCITLARQALRITAPKFSPPNLDITAWRTEIGIDRRDVNVAAQPAMSLCVWGAQVESNNAAQYSSIIKTAGASATRAVDSITVPGLSLSAANSVCMAASMPLIQADPDTDKWLLVLEDSNSNYSELFLDKKTATTWAIELESVGDTGDLLATETTPRLLDAGMRVGGCVSPAQAMTLYRNGYVAPSGVTGTTSATIGTSGTLYIVPAGSPGFATLHSITLSQPPVGATFLH